MSALESPGRSYCEVRDRTEALASPLGPEDQVVQSMPDCSPTKWHRAHTTWFFEEFVLTEAGTGHQVVNPEHRFLFNSYYESVGDRHPRPRRGLITRPTVTEVGRYRRRVDDSMVSLLDGDVPDPVRDLVELGLHHEEQHQELLLMDAKHLLFQNPLRPAYSPTAPEPGTSPVGRRPGWINHDGGLVEVGHGGPGFGFDNESPRHAAHLSAFALADRLVTCGEWLEFMDDGGYRRPDLWLSDGWAAVNDHGWDAPLYWDTAAGTSDSWEVFTLAGRQPLHPAQPVVHVSLYEADAYARWRGARLPTEIEWEAVASNRWSGTGTDPFQFQGSAWQWTASAYLAYPGFRPAAGAVGEYNGKFMVNQHVLRGGCCATPLGHSRPTYRNFYPPGSQWMFAGVRLACDV